MDLAKIFATGSGCDIVLANDPDADRLAVAEKDRTTGEWTIFSGDQIGAMLGLWIWEAIGVNSDKVRRSSKKQTIKLFCPPYPHPGEIIVPHWFSSL